MTRQESPTATAILDFLTTIGDADEGAIHLDELATDDDATTLGDLIDRLTVERVSVAIARECAHAASVYPDEDGHVYCPTCGGSWTASGGEINPPDPECLPADGGDPILCPRCEGDESADHNGYGDDCDAGPTSTPLESAVASVVLALSGTPFDDAGGLDPLRAALGLPAADEPMNADMRRWLALHGQDGCTGDPDCACAANCAFCLVTHTPPECPTTR